MKDTISIFEVGRRYIRLRPDNFDELLLNFSVDNQDINLYECNMLGCLQCRSNICELCTEYYEKVDGKCIECIYPKLVVWGWCKTPTLQRNLNYLEGDNLTNALDQDLPQFTLPYFIRI